MNKMIYRILTALLLSCPCVSAALQADERFMPESVECEQIALTLYVEPEADEATRSNLCDAAAKAEKTVHRAYGDVKSRPVIMACVSEAYFQAFRGGKITAATLGSAILLSPHGLDQHIIAHEWSHAEMWARLTIFAWHRIPAWFHEGTAVAVSEDPRLSESQWQFLLTTEIPYPTPEDLYTLKNQFQWRAAIRKYSSIKDCECKANKGASIAPVYAAAGHEVRLWFAKAGTRGLLSLIARINRGQDFETAYRSIFDSAK